MMRPFRFFAGGPIGSGRQYMPWVHRLDWIEMVRWIVDTPAVKGPVNVSAPHPVTNAEFARALGRALRRPALLPAPGFALKIVLGEMADAALTGQRALPGVAARARLPLPLSRRSISRSEGSSATEIGGSDDLPRRATAPRTKITKITGITEDKIRIL